MTTCIRSVVLDIIDYIVYNIYGLDYHANATKLIWNLADVTHIIFTVYIHSIQRWP